MQATVPEVMNIADEPQSVHDMYGSLHQLLYGVDGWIAHALEGYVPEPIQLLFSIPKYGQRSKII